MLRCRRVVLSLYQIPKFKLLDFIVVILIKSFHAGNVDTNGIFVIWIRGFLINRIFPFKVSASLFKIPIVLGTNRLKNVVLLVHPSGTTKNISIKAWQRVLILLALKVSYREMIFA